MIACFGLAGLSCEMLYHELLRDDQGPLDPEFWIERQETSEAATDVALEGPADVEVNPPSGALEGLLEEIPPQGFPEEAIPEGLGAGDIQITLLWIGDADIDLHVTDPFGEEIYFMHDVSASGGVLDHDMIPCGGNAGQPVENVFWPSGGAPRGRYQIAVVYYSRCDTPDPTSFEVIVRISGQIYDRRTGTINESERLEVISFDL
jgi:hypothetical protein